MRIAERMATRYGWLSLLQVLLTSQAVVLKGETLFMFDVDIQANIYATASGFLYYPRPHNGCTPLIDPPPSSSNWFALLDDFNTCTLEKINNTRNAGYQMLFTASDNDADRKLTDKVIGTEFPIAVPHMYQADYLKYNATTIGDGPIYVTVQLLIVDSELEIQVLVIDNSSYPITPSPPPLDSSTIPLIVFVCLLSVFIVLTIAMIGIRCAHNLSHNDSDSMDVTSLYGAVEKQKATTNINIQSDTKQKASVQLVNMKDSFRTHTSAGRHHRGGVATTQKTHLKTHHHTNAHNKGIQRQMSLPANPQTYSYLRAQPWPPAEHSPSDSRTASWVHSHFGSCSESTLTRPYDLHTDSCTPTCVVCVEKFREGEPVVALPCDVHHIFHWKCIIERLARSGMKCPLCTAQI